MRSGSRVPGFHRRRPTARTGKALRCAALGALAAILAAGASPSPGIGRATPHGTFPSSRSATPSLDEVIVSRRDLWGELALRQPEGPDYAFFRRLLPPLRYVDAWFRHYPIVLSAPGSLAKARLISNGSALNALARQPNWRGETGRPVFFRVGAAGEPFGEDLRRLDGPRYAEGWLPVVRLRYRVPAPGEDAVYAMEAFAAVEPEREREGVVFVRITLERGTSGRVTAQVEGADPWIARDGRLRAPEGRALLAFDGPCQWNGARNTAIAQLRRGEAVRLAVALAPTTDAALPRPEPAVYQAARDACCSRWRTLLREGMEIETPERVVNDAWRAVLAGSYALLHGDEIRYSAGNQYARLYIAEGGDAVRAFFLWGHGRAARRMLVPLFAHTRRGLEYHQAAFKLQMLAHAYRLTRDRDLIRELRPRWEKELEWLRSGIEPGSGLLPREKYCGDLENRVYSLNSNANGWRALRDWSVLLADLGDGEAARTAERAAALRGAVQAATETSIRRDVSPPFVPIALFGEEAPYDPLTATRMGSYWDLMAPYVLGSGLFPPDSPVTTAIVRYLQEKGGLCMGLVRTRPNPTFWVDVHNVNDLYTLRYVLTLLRRDEPDRALVSFYGKLAQGFTRDTFIGAEATALRPLDPFGRQMYLPPNSASNAVFLWMLRELLIQDVDRDDDGRPDTLRLLYAAPRAWLRDGSTLRVRRAPTAFGEVALTVRSRLRNGEVRVEGMLPEPAPPRVFVRLRLPPGWKLVGAVDAARGAGRIPRADPETLDLSGASGGRFAIRAAVARIAGSGWRDASVPGGRVRAPGPAHAGPAGRSATSLASRTGRSRR